MRTEFKVGNYLSVRWNNDKNYDNSYSDEILQVIAVEGSKIGVARIFPVTDNWEVFIVDSQESRWINVSQEFVDALLGKTEPPAPENIPQTPTNNNTDPAKVAGPQSINLPRGDR